MTSNLLRPRSDVLYTGVYNPSFRTTVPLTVASLKTRREASVRKLLGFQTVACCHDTILTPSLLLYMKVLCSRAYSLHCQCTVLL